MSHPLLCRRDVNFLLHDWLQVTGVDRETVDGFIDLSEKLASDSFQNHYKRSDVEEPVLAAHSVRVCPAIGEALRQYAALGLFSASFPESLGGLAVPQAVCAASFAYFAAANIATAAYPMLTVANARLIASFGTTEQIEAICEAAVRGPLVRHHVLVGASGGFVVLSDIARVRP